MPNNFKLLLRDHLKNKVYEENFEDKEHLLHSVLVAFDRIAPETLNFAIDSTVSGLLYELEIICLNICYNIYYLQFLTIILVFQIAL